MSQLMTHWFQWHHNDDNDITHDLDITNDNDITDDDDFTSNIVTFNNFLMTLLITIVTFDDNTGSSDVTDDGDVTE